MRPETQRIKIAEACGYKYPCPSCFNNGNKDRWRNLADTGCVGLSDLPDYLNDLNAIHDAENILTEEQHRKFTANLWMLMPCQHLISTPAKNVANEVVSATAAQRAEAFLRTLNLWKNE